MSDWDDLLARLSAEQRAQLAWLRPRLEAALRRLQTEPLTPELIKESCKQTAAVLLAFAELTETVFPGEEMIRDTWQDKLPRLREYLSDSASADAAEWAMRVVMVVHDLLIAVARTDIREQIKVLKTASPEQLDAGIEAELSKPIGPILRAQVLVMAILDAADTGVDRARGEQLADEAMLAAAEGVDAFARFGVNLDPYQGSAPAERGARAARYATSLRRALSDDDVDSIERARIHSLR